MKMTDSLAPSQKMIHTGDYEIAMAIQLHHFQGEKKYNL